MSITIEARPDWMPPAPCAAPVHGVGPYPTATDDVWQPVPGVTLVTHAALCADCAADVRWRLGQQQRSAA